MSPLLSMLAFLAIALESPVPPPATPGSAYTPPEHPTAEGAPLVYSFTEEAGPDQSFLLVGEGLTDQIEAWGAHPEHAGGRAIQPKVQSCDGKLLIATLPEQCYDGPIVVWVKNQAGWSEPVVLNQPNPWWCRTGGGETMDRHRLWQVFGRNLARRPDQARAFVYLAQPGKPGRWLSRWEVGELEANTTKHRLKLAVPKDLEPGEYELWVHAGQGGEFGWGRPLKVTVDKPAAESQASVTVADGDIQKAVDAVAAKGGGTVEIPAGVFPLRSTLIIPANVHVEGAWGEGCTVLQAPSDPAAPLPCLTASGWSQGVGAIHTPGDTMAYKVEFPAAGKWSVWLRYATEMTAYNQPGVSKNMTLAVDGGPAVPLDNLPNTGSFGTFKWSRSATIEVAAGRHELVWKNEKGGGINLDAFLFTLDPARVPNDNPPPQSDAQTVVLQGEDVVRFETKEGKLPGGDRAAVWLAGDNSALHSVTVCGSTRTNIGVAVRSRDYPAWINDVSLYAVQVKDVEGKQAENCGVRLFHAQDSRVTNCNLWGRTPMFLSGVRGCDLSWNHLTSVTRWGGNSEAYILGRNDTVRNCIIEHNTFRSPPGMNAGGPTGRRMIWLSTGHGSVDHNWIADNREDRARFGGVAGTDQNVGEMILFEACERIAYYGPLAAADAQSVTLPEKLPPTPDERLGSVKREQLAHDADGNETPFWPPDADDGTTEPPAGEYFVTILKGRGMGQTRQVVARRGATYQLDRPWRVAPQADGLASGAHGLLSQSPRRQPRGRRHDGHPVVDLVHRKRALGQRGRAPAEAGAVPVRQLLDAGFVHAADVEPRHRAAVLQPHRGHPLRRNQLRGAGRQRRGARLARRVPAVPGQRAAAQLVHPQPHRRAVDYGQPPGRRATAGRRRAGHDRRVQRGPRRARPATTWPTRPRRPCCAATMRTSGTRSVCNRVREWPS